MSEETGSELPANNRHALRLVARGQRKAALATSMEGRPYVSLVTLAFDHDLSPILLLSRLADHTRNLLADAKAAVLLEATEGLANPQTGPRVTLLGEAERMAAPGSPLALVVAPPISSGRSSPARSIWPATWTISSSDGVINPLRPTRSARCVTAA